MAIVDKSAGIDPVYKQYMRLRAVSENLSEDTLSVLMDSLRLVQSTDGRDIPRHMTAVIRETWLAYSRVAPERYADG